MGDLRAHVCLAAHATPSHRVAAAPSDQVFEGWADGQRLSPMQRDVLVSDAWVRIVDAPTGSGKSFAFQKAVLPVPGYEDTPGRVLFVAPTRRLTEALSLDLKAGLAREVTTALADEVKQGRLSQDEVRRRAEQVADFGVLTWNGAQRFESGVSGAAARWGQLGRQPPVVDGLPAIAQTVFTVLEVLEGLLFPRRLRPGAADDHGQKFLGEFRHIVFDEFHTLGEGGTALALVTVNLVRAYNQTLPSWGTPIYVTFLSATPVDLLSFISQSLDQPLCRLPPGRLGQSGDGVCLIQETVVSRVEADPATSRVLHGDIQLQLIVADTMLGLLYHCQNAVLESLSRRQQVVVIFDAKYQLLNEQAEITGWLKSLCSKNGLNEPTVLCVNGSDDRSQWAKDAEEFMVDRPTMQAADVLLATSSVEAGVTFRDNSLLLMEPGFSPLNFVQRLGRCARGNRDGQVFVRLDDAATLAHDFRDWWKVLVGAIETTYAPDDQVTTDIGSFLAFVRQHSEVVPVPVPSGMPRRGTPAVPLRGDMLVPVLPALPNAGFYSVGHLGERARCRAMLYWAIRYREMERFLPRNQHKPLMGNPPRRVIWMFQSLIIASRLLGKTQSAKTWRRRLPATIRLGSFDSWLRAWVNQACSLRNIGPQVMVIDRHQGGLRCRPFERMWLLKSTNAFQWARPASATLIGQVFGDQDTSHLEIMDATAQDLVFYSKQERLARKHPQISGHAMDPRGGPALCAERKESLPFVTSEALKHMATQLDETGGQGSQAARALRALAAISLRGGCFAPCSQDWDDGGSRLLDDDMVL